jgi:SAM-dependent methyltransferase
MDKKLPDFSKDAYGEAAALRYNLFESKSTGFAIRMAPKIQAFYQHTKMARVNKKLLDVACGTGQLASCFLEQGYEVTGLDLAPHMVKQAKTNNAKYVESKQCNFKACDSSNFNLEPQFGLAVSTFNGMNHLPNFEKVEKCLANVYHALVEGGFFIFDINTQLGLKRVVENFGVVDTDDEITVRKRLFDGERVILNASGCFKHKGTWKRYQETIFKIIIDTKALKETMFNQGWSSLLFTKDDLISPVEDPELEEVAYIVACK